MESLIEWGGLVFKEVWHNPNPAKTLWAQVVRAYHLLLGRISEPLLSISVLG